MSTEAEHAAWLDPAEWHREGRGRTWAFLLPTDAVVRALESTEERLGDQLQLLACERMPADAASRSIYAVRPLQALEFAGRREYFVRSTVISPTLRPSEPLPGVGWPAVFVVNGLVALDHPFPSKTDQWRSNIGIVHRVRNDTTGESVEHHGYDRIFKALKRALQAEVHAA